MEYEIVLIQSEEGWAASCPALRGCHSQGVTREEAVANIHVAICEWIGLSISKQIPIPVRL